MICHRFALLNMKLNYSLICVLVGFILLASAIADINNHQKSDYIDSNITIPEGSTNISIDGKPISIFRLSNLINATLENDTYILDAKNIIVSREIKYQLHSHYFNSAPLETAMCIDFDKMNKTIILTDVRPAQISKQTQISVAYSCPKGSIVLHTHPTGECMPSNQDVKTAEKYFINGIYCNDILVWYGWFS